MQKKNILFVLNSLGTGGSERVVLDISRRIDRDKFVPYVLGINPPCELEIKFRENNIWARCLTKRKGIDFRLMMEVFRIMRDKQIDIVNAHHFSPFVHASIGSILNGSYLSYTDHTVAEIRRIPLFWKILGMFLLKKSFAVIGISHGCTRELQKTFHVKKAKTHTILNAIDIDRFTQKSIDKKALKKNLNLKSDDAVIGMVGNLRPQKNHASLIKACRIMLDMGNPVKILIIGDGPLRTELENLSSTLGVEEHVLFLGARHDVSSLYMIMDVYCLCSHYEGLPLTILEAMTSRIPVVGTDVDGIREIIRHEKTGMIVEADDPEALAYTLNKILKDRSLAYAIASNGYHYVEKKHGMASWIESYKVLFSSPFQP